MNLHLIELAGDGQSAHSYCIDTNSMKRQGMPLTLEDNADVSIKKVPRNSVKKSI